MSDQLWSVGGSAGVKQDMDGSFDWRAGSETMSSAVLSRRQAAAAAAAAAAIGRRNAVLAA